MASTNAIETSLESNIRKTTRAGWSHNAILRTSQSDSY